MTIPEAYIPLIEKMKFYIEPEISCSRFFATACFTEESLNAYRKNPTMSSLELLQKTELGQYVSDHLQDGLFIDVPCGFDQPRDAEDFAMIPLAAALGISRYWEIDKTADVLTHRMPSVDEMTIRQEGSISVTTMQNDLLAFIATLSDTTPSPKAFYISALQPDADFCSDLSIQRDVAVPYLTALYDELARVCVAGDLVILNSSAMLVAGIDEETFPMIHPALALPARGFSLMRRCALDKVHVFKKD